MKTPKNPGLSARTTSVSAALEASSSQPERAVPGKPADKGVAISVRFPTASHEALRRIAFEQRVSINSLIMAGVEHIIKQRG